MTILFHRLAVPTYFGGLPADHDYMNNAVSGTPAYANGVLASGPNTGSYFIGFGEDATSADANRPALALAQNTDYLDNLLHRDIAQPVRTGSATGAPTSSLLLTGPGIFMGLGGAAIADVFTVTDSKNEAIDVSGVAVAVSAAVDSGSVVIGGGFSAGNVTLTFVPTIPSGQDYRVNYAQRTNLATLPADVWTSIHIRSLTDVSYPVEELLRLLHGNSESWNAAWDSTIWDLTARGFDGAYRRSAAGVAGTLGVAGSGAGIIRDGVALSLTSTQTARAYLDTYQQMLANYSDELGIATGTGALGSSGFLYQSASWLIQGASGDYGTQGVPGLYAFAALQENQSATVSGTPASNITGSHAVFAGYATLIPAGSAATITATGTLGIYEVVLTGSTFFWKSFPVWNGSASITHKETTIGLGHDMLAVTLPGGKVISLIITTLDLADTTGKSAHCCVLDDDDWAAFDSGTISVTVTWVQPRMTMGMGGAILKADYQASSGKESYVYSADYAFGDDMFFCAPPIAPLTSTVGSADTSTDWYSHVTPCNAYFGGTVDWTNSGALGAALSWGTLDRDVTHADTYGHWLESGSLWADGSLSATLATIGNGGLSVGGPTALSQTTNVYAPLYFEGGSCTGAFSVAGPFNLETLHTSVAANTTLSPVLAGFSTGAISVGVPFVNQVICTIADNATAGTIASILLDLPYLPAAVGQKFTLVVLVPATSEYEFSNNVSSLVDSRTGSGVTVTTLFTAAPTARNLGFTYMDVYEFTCVYKAGTQTTYVGVMTAESVNTTGYGPT